MQHQARVTWWNWGELVRNKTVFELACTPHTTLLDLELVWLRSLVYKRRLAAREPVSQFH